MRDIGQSQSLQEVLTTVTRLCEKAIVGDLVFLMLKDEVGDELVCVARSGKDYNPKGHFRLSLSETVAREAAIALNVQSLRDQRHQAEQRIKDSE